MKDPSKLAAIAVLALGPIAYLAGGVSLDECKGLLLGATVAWFAASAADLKAEGEAAA